MITSSQTPPLRNPYIIGRPIGEPNFLIGRESLFDLIRVYLQDRQQIMLLHGQRRIGKSSVISNISTQLEDLNQFVFVSFDLQSYNQKPLSSIFADLAEEIIDHLELDEDNITLPENIELELEPDVFYHQFLSQIYEKLEDKNLVLLLDEFDSVSSEDSKSLLENICQFLFSIIDIDTKLFIVICIGEQLATTSNIINIFNNLPQIEIGLLDEESTKNLIVKPAEHILEYEEEAIKEIFNLSAGHPYFTQVICFAIFSQARQREIWTITKNDVDDIVDDAIELGEAGLAWFWEGFSSLEKVVFAAVAEAQKNQEDALKLLESLIPNAERENLIAAKEQLKQYGFLDQTGRKVKIELVRRWIIKRHPLREQITELDQFESQNYSEDKLNQHHSSQENIIPTNNHNNINEGEIVPSIPTENTNTYNIPNNRQDLDEASTANHESIISKNNLIVSGTVIIFVFVLVLFLINRLSTSCSVNQQKVLGVFCIGNQNISRGDYTFFPLILNPSRDRGIEEFKKGNYQEAAKFFEKAVKANRNDPEVLIYYNNAIALQGNSPFSLAVVVPADSKTETAQEMLRGVAQAQNEFNNQKGLKGRLLEIVITNDDNKPEKAKQVAQELVQDSSILGVIGHNSSNATQAALPEYKPARLAVVSPTSTSCFLNNEVFLRTVYSDANAGEKLAKYASNNLKLKKVVIFGNPKSEYSNTSREVFTREFEKLGGEVVRKPLIDLTDVNFDKYSEVNKIKDEVEAAILFPDTENTDIAIDIAIANEKSNTNLENQPEQALKFLGGDTLYSIDTINKGGKAVEGMIVSVPWFRETSKAEKFAEKSKQQWRRNVSWRTATSYDATQAFIKALSLSSNPSRTTVLKNLKNVTLSPDETSGYGFKFTEEREREGEPVLLEVKDGKFTYLL